MSRHQEGCLQARITLDEARMEVNSEPLLLIGLACAIIWIAAGFNFAWSDGGFHVWFASWLLVMMTLPAVWFTCLTIRLRRLLNQEARR